LVGRILRLCQTMPGRTGRLLSMPSLLQRHQAGPSGPKLRSHDDACTLSIVAKDSPFRHAHPAVTRNTRIAKPHPLTGKDSTTCNVTLYWPILSGLDRTANQNCRQAALKIVIPQTKHAQQLVCTAM
jgi:hypothetical protein